MRLGEIEAVPGPGTLSRRGVRITPGVPALGCNAYTAGAARQDVLEPHTQAERFRVLVGST